MAIKLPQGQAAEEKIEHQITIAVQKDGQITLNKMPVTAEGLKSALPGLLHGHDNVVIAADKDARHGDVVKAMLQARAAGVNAFSIAVDNE